MSDPLRKELQAGPDFMTKSSNNDFSDSVVGSFTSAIVQNYMFTGPVAKVDEHVKKKQTAPANNTKSDMMVSNGDSSNGSIQNILNPAAIIDSLVPNNQIKYQHKGLGRLFFHMKQKESAGWNMA